MESHSCILISLDATRRGQQRLLLVGRRRTRTRRRRSIIPCCRASRDDARKGKFLPGLNPKPRPSQDAVERSQRQEEEQQEDYRRKMVFLENFPDVYPQREEEQQEDDGDGDGDADADDQQPTSQVQNPEIRQRLLMEQPEPLPEEDYNHPNVAFDMFEHLVQTIRHILNFRYQIGDRLDRQDELILVDEALAYHPNRYFKVGCGIDHLKIDLHPDYLHCRTRCFMIVRKDQSEIDFSYRKCMMARARALQAFPIEYARDLIYFFRTPNGHLLPRYYTFS